MSVPIHFLFMKQTNDEKHVGRSVAINQEEKENDLAVKEAPLDVEVVSNNLFEVVASFEEVASDCVVDWVEVVALFVVLELVEDVLLFVLVDDLVVAAFSLALALQMLSRGSLLRRIERKEFSANSQHCNNRKCQWTVVSYQEHGIQS